MSRPTSDVDQYAARIAAKAPPLTAAQRDAISAAFSRLRPPRKREAA